MMLWRESAQKRKFYFFVLHFSRLAPKKEKKKIYIENAEKKFVWWWDVLEFSIIFLGKTRKKFFGALATKLVGKNSIFFIRFSFCSLAFCFARERKVSVLFLFSFFFLEVKLIISFCSLSFSWSFFMGLRNPLYWGMTTV